jgi:hypothetical protein
LVENLSTSRLDQIEDRISGLEDKVDILDHLNEDKGKKMKKCDHNRQELWNTIKRENP